MIRIGERSHTGGEGTPPDGQRLGCLQEQLGHAIATIGVGSENTLELRERSRIAGGADRVGVGQRPTVRHARDHHRRIEDPERRGDDLSAHLAEQRPAAREVGRTIRQGHAVRLMRRGFETEPCVSGVALG